jgi:TPP-dependent pyruvate/acetoin dehydrogenase alpha subunit
MSSSQVNRRPEPVPALPGDARPHLRSVPAGEEAAALDLYRGMQLVRAVELAIESMHKRGRMSGSFHSSMGQEACAVGVSAALRPEDMVTSTHRGHGHAVAKGVPVEGIFAELFGRSTGVSGGRGGSMHLHHRESGFLGENAIVGGGLPWAAGAAWARKRLGKPGVAVAFTGDGGAAEGVFHEVLLLSRFWGSPCLIVCENNGLAHSMPSERLWGVPGSIARMVEATGVQSRAVDGRDVLAVRDTAEELLAHVRDGQPAFMECIVFRVRPHSIADPDYRYRDRDAGAEWMKTNDPIENLRSVLEGSSGEELDRIDREVGEQVEAALAAAEAAPQTPAKAALVHRYATPELDERA